jgi:hypothetical protein
MEAGSDFIACPGARFAEAYSQARPEGIRGLPKRSARLDHFEGSDARPAARRILPPEAVTIGELFQDIELIETAPSAPARKMRKSGFHSCQF